MVKEEISTQPDEGAELRKMREQVGMTQTELAKRAHVSLNLISMLEAGRRNFTQKSREKIYRVLVEAEQASRKAPSVLTTLGALAKANPEVAESAWSPLSSFEFINKNFGLERTVELQNSLIEGLQKENESLKQQLDRDGKIIEMLQDNATIKAALGLVHRVKLLEKDNADLKRLVGLKSEEVHLESEVESRAEKKDE